MKRNCCSQCRREIDKQDFYMECRRGKICSDCLIQAGPVDKNSAKHFRPRGPKGEQGQPRKRSASLIALPLKQAL